MSLKSMIKQTLFLAAVSCMAAAVPVAAQTQTPQANAQSTQQVRQNQPAGLSGKALYDEAISISKLLRDPASVNYTLFDSESAIAGELKARIYEMLREGKSREEIFDFMVARYGEMIRYEPDFNAKTALLWAAPWAVLIAGGVLVALRMRRRVKKNQPTA